MKNYDYIVYIGRFQPFHNGHMATLSKAIHLGQKVIVILGSANSPRTFKNPWTAPEREIMIRSCLSATENDQVEFLHIEDRLYSNEKWLLNVREEVNRIVDTTKGELDEAIGTRIAIIGHDKDESSYYTKEFPDWTLVETGAHIKERVKGKPISSTKIRELAFTNHLGYIESNVPPAIYSFLENFSETDEFDYVRLDYEHYVNEENQYKDAIPYHMNFNTADGVVMQSNHVLLVLRDNYPGKDLWALPGGHVGVNETAFEGCIRETIEETSIKVPLGKLIGSRVLDHVFDHPERSLRCRVTGKYGRTTTRAFCFKLDGTKSSGESVDSLPRVKGETDAREARWFPLNEIRNMRSVMFEDHPDIIEYFVDRLPKSDTSSW
jgi:bifunctional NMN adenylyltransferase/nudix hydrolase